MLGRPQRKSKPDPSSQRSADEFKAYLRDSCTLKQRLLIAIYSLLLAGRALVAWCSAGLDLPLAVHVSPTVAERCMRHLRVAMQTSPHENSSHGKVAC
jgi:hypothetical protein